MKFRNVILISLLVFLLPALAAGATTSKAAQITGKYIEARSADVYTGPCFANSEVNLAGQDALEAGKLVKISTRALTGADEICHNEETFYQPLAAHLNHAMPAYTAESTYRGNHLDINWSESGRRGSFVGTFTSPI